MLFRAKTNRPLYQRQRSNSFWRMVLPVCLLILVPIFTYAALELASSSEREQLIQNLYQAQLNAILFSVNQYCGMWSTAGEIFYGLNCKPMAGCQLLHPQSPTDWKRCNNATPCSAAPLLRKPIMFTWRCQIQWQPGATILPKSFLTPSAPIARKSKKCGNKRAKVIFAPWS